MRSVQPVPVLAVVLLLAGCDGLIFGRADQVLTPGPGGNGGGAQVTDPLAEVSVSGARRLTRTEYLRTVYDLLEVDLPEAFTSLPDDPGVPFDNDYRAQQASQALIEATQQLAELAADRALSDAARRDRIVGCSPSGPDDAACFRAFVTTFGRRALRRELDSDDLAAFTALQALSVEAGDFYRGVRVALRAFLQHPELLYRLELGERDLADAALTRLDDFSIATRMSYLLVGSTPDEGLLELAATHQLSTPDQRRAAALRLVYSDRGREQVQRFHASWLGYAQMQAPSAQLMASMQRESTALVDRVVFTRREKWTALFTSTETFVDDALAQHYGLPTTGSTAPRWVSYGTSGRGGILSHGGFLSNGVRFGDTSPTQRGKLVRNRLLCTDIGPPPPDVMADAPPATTSSGCKVDMYKQHSTVQRCAGCHRLMDPIGFGLEAYDAAGRFRTHDAVSASCTISGDGELPGAGTFNGPGQLGAMLVDSGQLEPCAVRQLFRFASGRKAEAGDTARLDALTKRFASDGRFDDLLLDLVSAEAFAMRRDE